MDNLPFYKRFWGHLSTITRHKIKVTKLCFRIGLYKQGLLHDLSKYSPIEFWAGVKYFQGNRSPIDKEKQVLGYSLGWLHHKGHNPHHWEYWMDKTDKVIFYPAPKHIVKEMVCDRVAACMTYQKKQYTDRSALVYFQNGTDRHIMNQQTAQLLEKYLTWIADMGLEEGFKRIKND